MEPWQASQPKLPCPLLVRYSLPVLDAKRESAAVRNWPFDTNAVVKRI